MEASARNSLSILPNEVLLHIISYLDNPLDCLHLGYCCHRLHALALPQVYSSIKITKAFPRPLSYLARTIIQNPSLGRTIRSMSLGVIGTDYLCGCCHDHREAVHDLAVITPVLDQVCWTRIQRWRMQAGLCTIVDDGSWLALMSPFLPNLERLYLGFPARPYGFGKMLQYIPSKMKSAAPFPFSSLIELSLASVEDMECPLFLLLDIFGLPSLRKFTGFTIIESIDDADYAISDDDSASGFSTVTHIKFESSQSDVGFRYLIRACAKLESFIYEIGPCDNNEKLLPETVYEALCEHRNTLEELTLVQNPHVLEPMVENILLGSFSEFSVLKRIRLRASNLSVRDPSSLADLLPSSLESLCVTEVAEVNCIELVRQLKDLISVDRPRVPRLAQLRIQDPMDEDDEMGWTPEMHDIYNAIACLKHDCWDAGIDYCIANWEFEGGFWKERHRPADRSSCSRPHFHVAWPDDYDLSEFFSDVGEDAHA